MEIAVIYGHPGVSDSPGQLFVPPKTDFPLKLAAMADFMSAIARAQVLNCSALKIFIWKSVSIFSPEARVTSSFLSIKTITARAMSSPEILSLSHLFTINVSCK